MDNASPLPQQEFLCTLQCMAARRRAVAHDRHHAETYLIGSLECYAAGTFQEFPSLPTKERQHKVFQPNKKIEKGKWISKNPAMWSCRGRLVEGQQQYQVGESVVPNFTMDVLVF